MVKDTVLSYLVVCGQQVVVGLSLCGLLLVVDVGVRDEVKVLELDGLLHMLSLHAQLRCVLVY